MLSLFNFIIFPVPKPTYSEQSINILKIPKPDSDKEGFIPVRIYESIDEVDTILIYFHGNAEDIGL